MIVALLMSACTCAAADPAPTRAELESAWRDYRRVFIQDDGRVVDRAGAHVSTSEGQAYAMVRAVWVDDRDTFERVRTWSVDNLQAHDPAKLPAWRWGEREDGGWGVLDENPASDADLWMSYALLLGARRWGEPWMKAQALELLAAVWEQETRVAGERRLLLPGPWAMDQDPIKVNPSYYLPFAFRLFATEDPAHDWASLVDESYRVIDETSAAAGLTPDWAWYSAETGALVAPPEGEEAGAAFGYEAFRVLWTLAAEWDWYQEPRAKALLERHDVLRKRWHKEGELPAVILPDGSAGRPYPYLGLYGAAIAAWAQLHPDDAAALYKHAIFPARTVSGWGDTEDYYAHNWVWFGLASWTGIAEEPKSP